MKSLLLGLGLLLTLNLSAQQGIKDRKSIRNPWAELKIVGDYKIEFIQGNGTFIHVFEVNEKLIINSYKRDFEVVKINGRKPKGRIFINFRGKGWDLTFEGVDFHF